MYGDITNLQVDAIVSSDDTYLTMGGGVSRAISLAGGSTIQTDAKKLIPLKVGDVAITSGGQLPVKYVFHAATLDYHGLVFPSDETIRNTTTKCLQLADNLNAHSIAFPALGTGVGGFPFQSVAEVMTSAIADYLVGKTQIQVVILTLFPRAGVSQDDLNEFYERAVGRASIRAQFKPLKLLMNKLEKTTEDSGMHSLSERISLLKPEFDHNEELSKDPNTRDRLERDHAEQLNEKIISISSEIHEFADKNKFVRIDALKTERAGLQGKLNIVTNKLNDLEIEERQGLLRLLPFPNQKVQEKERLKKEISDLTEKREKIDNLLEFQENQDL